MQRLDLGAVKNWSTITPPAVVTPSAITLACSYCFSYVVITVSHLKYDHPRKTVSCSGACPACGEIAHFWVTGVAPKNESTTDLELYTRPVNHRFTRVSENVENIPEPIQRNYAAAVDAFSSRNTLATVVLCRATIKAMQKHVVPGGKRRRAMAKSLEQAGTAVDLAKPLVAPLAKPLATLLKLVQKDDCVGAHFNPVNQPDEQTAYAMLEMTGLLISYMFSVPGQIDKLEKFLGSRKVPGPGILNLPADTDSNH